MSRGRRVMVWIGLLSGCRYGFSDRGDGGTGANDGAPGDGPTTSLGDSTITASSTILFVRGGAGTVGYVNPGGDANASDVFDNANTEGWGKLGTTLTTAGFTVVQHLEGPKATPAPADLSNLTQYRVVVFGSNNYPYTSTDADAVEAYVRAGGGVLFISDAGFNLTSYQAAPTSDQIFMSRFDLVMDQDVGGGVTEMSANFAVPGHPVLAGVTAFTANGTSSVSVTNNIADVTPTILVPRTGQIRQNNGSTGTLVAAGPNDAALVVASAGAGRVAGEFDRDTFVNNAIASQSNTTLAINLFRWLAGQI